MCQHVSNRSELTRILNTQNNSNVSQSKYLKTSRTRARFCGIIVQNTNSRARVGKQNITGLYMCIQNTHQTKNNTRDSHAMRARRGLANSVAIRDSRHAPPKTRWGVRASAELVSAHELQLSSSRTHTAITSMLPEHRRWHETPSALCVRRIVRATVCWHRPKMINDWPKESGGFP